MMKAIANFMDNPTCNYIKDIQEICRPALNLLQVKYFAYSVIDTNGSRAILCNSFLDILKKYHTTRTGVYRFKKSDYFPFDDFLLNRVCYFFDSDILKSPYFKGYYYLNDYRKYNIVDRFFISHKTPIYSENFIFYFKSGAAYLSVILNNLDNYLQFTKYLKDKAYKLIQHTLSSPIIPAWCDVIQFEKSHKPGEFNTLSPIDTKILLTNKKLFLNLDTTKKLYLTQSEQKYARYIICGMNAREIAENCFVLNRTKKSNVIY